MTNAETQDTNSESQTLFAICRTKGNHYLITSPLIPELVTEGDDQRNSIELLEDALGLLIDIMDDSKDTERFESSHADVNMAEDSGFSSLVDVKYGSGESIILSSTLIPTLLTEGKGVKDTLVHLKDALGLILESDTNKELLDKLNCI